MSPPQQAPGSPSPGPPSHPTQEETPHQVQDPKEQGEISDQEESDKAPESELESRSRSRSATPTSEQGQGSESGSAQEQSKEDAESQPEDEQQQPPLPDEEAPPLPDEAAPGDDDGWQPVWDPSAQAYYFYNRFTGVSQWENPRVPSEPQPGVDDAVEPSSSAAKKAPVIGGYNPAIHGDYDPTAPYAQQYEPEDPAAAGAADPAQSYEMTGAFNRFTGRWQSDAQNPEQHNDENKSRRQMYAFFDVDAAANTHDGRSLRAERSAKKLSKKELKMFKEKRREKKEEKRRAWLRD
ncbi:hypothetical protein P170DRAFT_439673 [Aspergillus steynii IBT 23096]|uniref:WW domain-containing protein n=1 Tax=Aspergillus steynii IBT 23096 TaxID=1392250 RepID=A0A2I2FZB8_9EURO|nr:uncharacterized protein P170DRAFT_439673 [Aspergillus steynii IBT 23096]PLB45973.1 hypothetical protein P170DRAFT_439673 [Aspergillus steynii IBT 23096]